MPDTKKYSLLSELFHIVVRYQWWLVACWAVGTFILGIYGFHTLKGMRETVYKGATYTYWDSIYLSLQLFLGGSGAQPNPNVALIIARLLAPMVVAWVTIKTVWTVLKEEIDLLRLKRFRDHTIICGFGVKGAGLASDCLGLFSDDSITQGSSNVFDNGASKSKSETSPSNNKSSKVIVIELDRGNKNIDLFRQQGVIIIYGNADSKEMLKKANLREAKAVWAVTGDDTTNISIAHKVQEMINAQVNNPIRKWLKDHLESIRKKNVNGTIGKWVRAQLTVKNMNKVWKKRTIECFVHVLDPRLRLLIATNHKLFDVVHDRFDGRSFNITEISARVLLRDYRNILFEKVDEDNWQPHILLLGYGWTGESLLRQAMQYLQYPGDRKLKITIIDKDKQKSQIIKVRYPFVEDFLEITFQEIDVEVLTKEKYLELCRPIFSIVFICLGSEILGVQTARHIKTYHDCTDVPIVVVSPQKSESARYLQNIADMKNRNVRIFPIIEKACEYLSTKDKEIELIAKAIHRNWKKEEEKKPDKSKVRKPSLVNWEDLHEESRESNRYSADHLLFKLTAMGLDTRKNGIGPAPLSIEYFDYKSSEYGWFADALAEMEHKRWMIEKYLEGWQLGARDDEKKIHPELLEWNALKDEQKSYDRQTTKSIPKLLEKNDLVVFKTKEVKRTNVNRGDK